MITINYKSNFDNYKKEFIKNIQDLIIMNEHIEINEREFLDEFEKEDNYLDLIKNLDHCFFYEAIILNLDYTETISEVYNIFDFFKNLLQPIQKLINLNDIKSIIQPLFNFYDSLHNCDLFETYEQKEQFKNYYQLNFKSYFHRYISDDKVKILVLENEINRLHETLG